MNIGIIFGLVGDKLGTKKFPSLGLLKGLLCLTPPLLLLLLHNADDLDRSQERKDLVFKLSFQMAIDLFDVIDMIDIVLDDIGRANETQSLPADVIATLNKTLKETLPSFTLNTTGILTSELNKSLAILSVFGRVMIGVACFSLMLSIWQWAENKHSTNDGYSISNSSSTQRSRGDLRQFLFLDHPGVVFFFKYGQDDFVFIAKNFTAILEIHALCQSHSSLCKGEWRKCSARLREFKGRLKRFITRR